MASPYKWLNASGLLGRWEKYGKYHDDILLFVDCGSLKMMGRRGDFDNLSPWLPVPPKPFTWDDLEENDFAFMMEEVERFEAEHPEHFPPDEKQDTANVKGAKTKSDTSLMKMVIGMAVGGYRYNPEDSKSEVPKQISEDLEECGVGIDIGTVRKWLKESAQLLERKDS